MGRLLAQAAHPFGQLLGRRAHLLDTLHGLGNQSGTGASGSGWTCQVDGQKFTAGAQVAGVTVAGKTGTAQLGGSGEPNSWFIGFAPAEAPTIALAVIVEHGGSGGARAAPLAGDLLRAYFAAQP